LCLSTVARTGSRVSQIAGNCTRSNPRCTRQSLDRRDRAGSGRDRPCTSTAQRPPAQRRDRRGAQSAVGDVEKPRVDAYASTRLVVFGLERLGADATQDRGQLHYRAGDPDTAATGAGTGQGVARLDPAQPGSSARSGTTGPAPQPARPATRRSGRRSARDAGRRPTDRVQGGHLQAELPD
jgi:hypothetical protein